MMVCARGWSFVIDDHDDGPVRLPSMTKGAKAMDREKPSGELVCGCVCVRGCVIVQLQGVAGDLGRGKAVPRFTIAV